MKPNKLQLTSCYLKIQINVFFHIISLSEGLATLIALVERKEWSQFQHRSWIFTQMLLILMLKSVSLIRWLRAVVQNLKTSLRTLKLPNILSVFQFVNFVLHVAEVCCVWFVWLQKKCSGQEVQWRRLDLSRWVSRHYTGDHFWKCMYNKLFYFPDVAL